jgi:hypothetical protein
MSRTRSLAVHKELELPRTSLRPNPSLNHRTRYGKHRKPGPRHLVHHREPGLRRSPPQAG